MLRLPTSLKVIWASPNSLLGLLVGAAGLLSGGRVQRRGRTLEFHGGAVSWVLDHLPAAPGILAMTLGHVILGQTGAADAAGVSVGIAGALPARSRPLPRQSF